jgi:hypothetical protein
MKNLFSLTLLVLLALFAIGCCNDDGITPEPPDQPDPPTVQQRYITPWGNNGDAGITITETPYQGTAENYVSITREQVATYYPDMSDEVLFPLDAEYYYWAISDLDHTLYITKWADGTTSYSIIPFGDHSNYDKVSDTIIVDTKPTEKITGFVTDIDPESDRFIQHMYHVSPDLNRDDYEADPSENRDVFELRATSGTGQYL